MTLPGGFPGGVRGDSSADDPEERELAVRLHQAKEDIPKNGIIIDATAPLARVVDEILRLSDANKPL